jgi:hypothetical protein
MAYRFAGKNGLQPSESSGFIPFYLLTTAFVNMLPNRKCKVKTGY